MDKIKMYSVSTAHTHTKTNVDLYDLWFSIIYTKFICSSYVHIYCLLAPLFNGLLSVQQFRIKCRWHLLNIYMDWINSHSLSIYHYIVRFTTPPVTNRRRQNNIYPMGMGNWPGPDDGDGCTFAGRSSDREVKTYESDGGRCGRSVCTDREQKSHDKWHGKRSERTHACMLTRWTGERTWHASRMQQFLNNDGHTCMLILLITTSWNRGDSNQPIDCLVGWLLHWLDKCLAYHH